MNLWAEQNDYRAGWGNTNLKHCLCIVGAKIYQPRSAFDCNTELILEMPNVHTNKKGGDGERKTERQG